MSYLYNPTSYALPEFNKDFTTAYSFTTQSLTSQYPIESHQKLEADRLLSSPTLIKTIIETHKQHTTYEAPSYGTGQLVLQSIDPLYSSTTRVFNFENAIPAQTNHSTNLLNVTKIPSLDTQHAHTSPSPSNVSALEDLGIQIPVRVPTFGEINDEEHSSARERIAKSVPNESVREKVNSEVVQPQQQVVVENQAQTQTKTNSEEIRPEMCLPVNQESKKKTSEEIEDDFELELEKKTAEYTLKLREKILASENKKQVSSVAEKPRKTSPQPKQQSEIKKEVPVQVKVTKTYSLPTPTESKPKKNIQQVTLDLRPYIQLCNTEPDYPTDLSDSLYAGVFNETQELKKKEGVHSNGRSTNRGYLQNITQSVRKSSRSPGNKSPKAVASYYRPVSTEKRNISSQELNSSLEKATQRNLEKISNSTRYGVIQPKRTERSYEGKKSYLSNLNETPRDIKHVSQSRPKSPQLSAAYPVTTRQQEKTQIFEETPKRKSSSIEKTSYIKDQFQVKRRETPQKYSDIKKKTSPRGYIVQTEPDMDVGLNKESTSLYKIVDNTVNTATAGFRQEDIKNYYQSVLKKRMGDTPSRTRPETNQTVPHEKPFTLYSHRDYSMKYSFHGNKCPMHGSQTAPESRKAEGNKYKAFI